MDTLSGQTIAGYEIVEKIGEGGMGTVYKARQPLLNRLAAVKIMAPHLAADRAYVARFKREATLAARINHPNVVQVYAAGEHGGTHFIAMEFVEGETLRDYIHRRERIEPSQALTITLHIAQALQHAWNQHTLIHRDIKPDNIFISKTGEVKVGDLGLAKSVGGETASGVTSTGALMGSPHYISPEQARGFKDIDFRADIYSLGCTLFHMLTGTTPYHGQDSLSVVNMHVHEPPPAIFKVWPLCPMPVALLVGKMLAKNRNERPQSYEELIAELTKTYDKLRQSHQAATVMLEQPPKSGTAAVAVVGGQAKPKTAGTKKRLVIGDWKLVVGGAVAAAVLLLGGLLLWSPWKSGENEQGRREAAKTGLESRLQAESAAGQPAKAGTPNPASSAAALKQLGSVFTNAVGAEMVYIPPGEFMLGSTQEEQDWALANGVREDEVKREGEAPRRAAIKLGFWMGRTEVTVGQWKQFVAATTYVTDAEKSGRADAPQGTGTYGRLAAKEGISWRNPGFGSEPRDDHPVNCISWNDAMAFCEWLNRREQQAGRLAQGYVVRLPAEAEWEYACRGGAQTKFWWGESPDDGKGRANWKGKADGFEFIAPVDSYGERGRNRFGLADMMGNILEKCLDEFDAKEAHEGLRRANHSGRVSRGGAFDVDLARCRCAYRVGGMPSQASVASGFRVVMGVDLAGARSSAATTTPAAPPAEAGILAPAETRVAALTTTPKVGEVFTLPLGSNVTMDLMGIPPGEFMMGSTKEERDWAVANRAFESSVKNEGETPRRATIQLGFWMGRTEVTVGQWKQFVAATGYVTDAEKLGESEVQRQFGKWESKKGVNWRNPDFGFSTRDDHPVSCISWNDAVAFCEWLTGREQQAGWLPKGWVIRLPANVEWEYACRAGTQTKFWWGDSPEDGKSRLNGVGGEDGFQFIARVDSYGTRGRNRFGLADMLGNMFEWCLDEFNDRGTQEGVWKPKTELRMRRSGSFSHVLSRCRCASLMRGSASQSGQDLGFRVVAGVNVLGAGNSATTTTPATAPADAGILAPAERRVAALTTTPKVGEVFTLPLGGNVTMDLMGIPPGEFLLGSTQEEQAWATQQAGGGEGWANEFKKEGEGPRKAIIKQGFWMGRTEVAVGQWKQFVAETGHVTDAEKKGESRVPGTYNSGPKKGVSWRNPDFGVEVRDDHPVGCMSWNDAVAFCKWLSERERQAGRLAPGQVVRLPTEAEWEYACRNSSQDYRCTRRAGADKSYSYNYSGFRVVIGEPR